MQFRYLKSFKKHRLNHALERLHGKKEINENTGELMVSSTNDDSGHIPKGIISLEDEQMLLDDQDQDDTIDSISNTNSNMNVSSNSVISKLHLNDPNSADNNCGGDIKDKSWFSSAITECDNQETNGNITSSERNQEEMNEMRIKLNEAEASALNFAMSSLPNTFAMQSGSTASTSMKASNEMMASGEAMSSQNFMGLNTQENSILNFLRVDTTEKRDKRFACPFCGKCVRSKENLKLHVRKHTGELDYLAYSCVYLTHLLNFNFQGERPFVCLFCGRAFGGKSDLTRHLRIHTGER